jgi:hypothetical protein
MKTQPTVVQLLGAAYPYALNELPPTIRIPAIAGHCTDEVIRPLDEATVDDVALSILGVEAEIGVVRRRLHALRELYELARKRGALGAHHISDTFADLRDEGGGQ